ncbi:pyruvate formate-lyase activating enzyme [Vibrio sp. JCM 18905]|nr:pyruvate formate-lyase activating enzyme [Vibrio sp. JCM 18905]
MHKWEALGLEYPLEGGVNPPPKETMDEIQSILAQYNDNVKY